MRIEALEAALNQVKLDSSLKVERVKMEMEASHSAQFNFCMDDSTLNRYINEEKESMNSLVTQSDFKNSLNRYFKRFANMHMQIKAIKK